MLRVLLTEFGAYRDSTAWTIDLVSASATFFVGDVMGLVSADDVSPAGLGDEDLVVTLGGPRVTVTLFCVQHGPDPRVEGVLLAIGEGTPPVEGWHRIAVGARQAQRFCVDSGAVVLGAIEALADVLRTRIDPEASMGLASRLSESGPVVLQDSVYFSADVNCHDCWGVGESGEYSAVYLDFSATKSP